jgi:hypothetical protein
MKAVSHMQRNPMGMGWVMVFWCAAAFRTTNNPSGFCRC